jgi:hypothetical protein
LDRLPPLEPILARYSLTALSIVNYFLDFAQTSQTHGRNIT